MESLDRVAFLKAFQDLSLSHQTQREFLEWLPEIAYSRQLSVTDLLQSDEVRVIIENPALNGPQKIETLRTLLYSWKYPLYSAALREWKKTAAATVRTVLENGASSQIVFVPSPAFEKNRLEVRISITHAKAAKEIFERLALIPQSTWGRLIYPVSQ